MSARRPVALVTGARRGIGRGIAYALAASGFDIVLNDVVDDAAAAETRAAIEQRGAACKWIVHDVAAIEGHADFSQQVFECFGTLDCLVNNAGVQVAVRGDMLDVTAESFDRLMDVNLRGTFFLTQAMARLMIKEARKPDDPHRSIVTISSVNARMIGLNRAEYCISKTGLSMMTQLYAARLAEYSIHAYEIRPGVIWTDMTANSRERYTKFVEGGAVPEKRWGQPEDIGRSVAVLAQGLMPYNTGDAFHVDGGMHIHAL